MGFRAGVSLNLHSFINELWYIRIHLMAQIHDFSPLKGARCSSMVQYALMVRWVFGSITHGGPIELFLIPASAP